MEKTSRIQTSVDSPRNGRMSSQDRSRRNEDDDECIGFASLPEQIHRKAVKRGFDFTLMVVGESGLGKSTLISSLFFNQELYKDRTITNASERIRKTIQLEKRTMEIEERGVKLRVTIVDTPGYNDAIECNNSWRPIEDYIYEQYRQYYKDESGLNRRSIKDNRVHCCLYFISPYGHGLKQTDIQFMLKLHDKVNIVPIIAKADTLTVAERKLLKAKIMDDIKEHHIRIYELPECDSDEDEDFRVKDQEIKAAMPFAVIGSDSVVEINGKKVKGRIYPWGIVDVENSTHSDFTKLRLFLLGTHMQDLKDVTKDVHYENFRARQIQEQMSRPGQEQSSELDTSDADQLLQQKETEIRRMQEMLKQMQAQLSKGQGGN